MRFCPGCKADLRGDPIPEEHKHLYGGDGYFYRTISVDIGRDRHDHWQCPDCGHQWGYPSSS